MNHSASRPFRITGVHYLNASPFRALEDLEWVQYEECEPRECARRLFEDQCDLGLLPLSEIIHHGELDVLAWGIIADGSVESVLLLSECPLRELDRIYIDSSSQTSVTLLKLLLPHLCGQGTNLPKLHRISADRIASLICKNNGGLVIGDSALQLRSRFSYEYDLAQVWHRETQLPFVFALWAGKPERLDEPTVSFLQKAFLRGIELRSQFARAFAEEKGLDLRMAERYVSELVQYRLDDRSLKGAEEFLKQGHEARIFPAQTLKFYKTHPAIGNQNSSVDSILLSASRGQRLSISQTLLLAEKCSLSDLGLAADSRRRKLHPKSKVSYIVDRNINYTNICTVGCHFCAFHALPGKRDGYVITREDLTQKIQEAVDKGAVQVLLQGGLHPELGIEYFEDLFQWIKSNFSIKLHALSADEILHIARISNLSTESALERLIEAGLDSLPGGGAEILVDRVRQNVSHRKCTAEAWLAVHRIAHRLGVPSSATMMFGAGESWEDRILHLHKLRQLQDETNGFTAFIPWTFQDKNTRLQSADTSSPDYLRVLALSRLFLDNFHNVQCSWVTQGPSVAQTALFFGANDFGSVMMEENVVSAAATLFHMDQAGIEQHILAAGFQPWTRDSQYQKR